MKRLSACVGALTILLGLLGYAQAQETVDGVNPDLPGIEDLIGQLDADTEDSSYLEVHCSTIDDTHTQDQCWASYRAYFDYYQSGFEHRKAVFRWQHMSTRIIFAVVIAIVMVGLYFSWIQFRMTDFTDPVPHNEIAVSTSSLKLSSPVLGVIILGLSLVFFYLYLVHVYPVHEIL